MIKLDRIKVVNGMCSTTSSDEIENIYLLNVLNWSQLENLTINKSIITEGKTIKDENELKTKNVYNTVEFSIDLQKIMLNLKSMFIDPSGRLVNYCQFRT
ncbi:unnamed protein product, partial [Rotaria sp. Silwood1]